MSDKTALISGSGIAGPTAAYFLAEAGYRVTLVERAADLRSSGSPVDVKGGALRVAERMGVYPRLRELATGTTRALFVDARGRPRATFPINPGRPGDAGVEIPRSDLAALLLDACRERAEVVLGDSITSLEQDDGGVDVSFEHGPARRFHVVVGADGLHSNVRRLAFGPERDFVRPMGLYVATMRVDVPIEDPRAVLMFNEPGRSVALHPCRGEPRVAFIFRGPPMPGVDLRDADVQKRILTETYGLDGWLVPEILDRLATTNDLYFDAVSQVRVDPWHRGRTVLAGDAASCLSLLGDGSTLAMLAGESLARALREVRDPRAAFERYEAEHRREVAPRRRTFGLAASFLVPRSALGIAARNAATKLMAPFVEAALA